MFLGLLCSSFLLTGKKGGLADECVAKVSVKNMSLKVISEIVILRPTVLTLPLEQLANDVCNLIELLDLEDTTNEISIKEDESDEKTELLLDIKENHFGECNSAAYFDYLSPMSNSGSTELNDEITETIKEDYTHKNDRLKDDTIILSKPDINNKDKSERNFVQKYITQEQGNDMIEDQQLIADVILYFNHGKSIHTILMFFFKLLNACELLTDTVTLK